MRRLNFDDIKKHDKIRVHVDDYVIEGIATWYDPDFADGIWYTGSAFPLVAKAHDDGSVLIELVEDGTN